MANTRDIRRRIKSVKSTSQITRAMQMVAASKMNKAQQVALAGRPYAALMRQVLARAIRYTMGFEHPLMASRGTKRRAVVVVSPDKGLCGSLIMNVMRDAMKYDAADTVYITVGRKASQFLTRMKRKVVAEFPFTDPPPFREARAISRCLQELFLKGEVDCVDVVFSAFVSSLVQRTESFTLLPMTSETLLPAAAGSTSGGELQLPYGAAEFVFEPSPEAVYGALLPHSLDFRLYQILLEVKASEHSARMVAMRNANDNAQQLMRELTLEYNQIRQANITQEILEISSSGGNAV
jgi:F-type H+-transporting ATPase subunit gamma